MRRTHYDRWLLSYADFVTLLFAVFVVFYAVKAKAHSQPSPAPAPVRIAEKGPESSLLEELKKQLRIELSTGSVEIDEDARGAVVSLDEQICFGAGEAEVQGSVKPVLQKLAAILSRYPNKLMLVGHTDSQPIHNKNFRSNWELSTARGISVMLALEEMARFDESRFLIEGAAGNKPVSDNDTDQGRARNRRVEIVALLDSASLAR